MSLSDAKQWPGFRARRGAVGITPEILVAGSERGSPPDPIKVLRATVHSGGLRLQESRRRAAASRLGEHSRTGLGGAKYASRGVSAYLRRSRAEDRSRDRSRWATPTAGEQRTRASADVVAGFRLLPFAGPA